jgi:hypothetical protein
LKKKIVLKDRRASALGTNREFLRIMEVARKGNQGWKERLVGGTGSRFSQYLFSDLRLGGLPSRKLGFGVGDSLMSLIEDIFVPGRRLNGFWTTGEVIPKQLHSGKLFVEGHLF